MHAAGRGRAGCVKISLVIVAYFSSSRLGVCLAGFRHEVGTVGLDAEVIIVDHSEDDEEAGRLRQFGADILLRQPNRGYAAGLNVGVRRASGDVLLLANPDILFLDGCVTRLLNTLGAGFSIVGPQLYWDRKGKIFLPPPEDPAPSREFLRRLRVASPAYWRRSLDAELDRVNRIWQAEGAVEVNNLRGPLLALRRKTWDDLGGMDEGYFLYFEETEWLLAARRHGYRLGLVGNAGLVHEWGHSTRNSATARAMETRSRIRFYRRNFSWSAPLLEMLPSDWSVPPLDQREPGGMEAMKACRADCYLFSPFEHFSPAAGFPGGSDWPVAAAELFRGRRWQGLAFSKEAGKWSFRGPWQWGMDD